MTEIRDEEDIKTYIESLKAEIPDIKAIRYVDVGEDNDEMVENYFKNGYKGTVLFMGIHEQKIKLDYRLTWLTVMCQMTILVKYNKLQTAELIQARKKAKKILLNVLHAIKRDSEIANEACMGRADNGLHWTFEIANGLIYPVGNINDAGCRGWSVDFEIGMPAVSEIN
jgi:hypothetical protein